MVGDLATLTDVFAEQIGDLYSAETQLVAALPRMVAAADDGRLREALSRHLDQTHHHVDRLRHIMTDVGIGNVATRQSEGMAGLLAEGAEIVRVPASGPAKDAALIAALQRVEHYEIAAYGTARTLAGELGYENAEDLLDETLTEESRADETLTKLAKGGLLRGGINALANRAAPPDA